ncbi:MAG TPA: hypothetical protein PK297_06475 [Spirochaetota bacterium]|nr:hypothetical protein [Spirochaetota bacterium]
MKRIALPILLVVCLAQTQFLSATGAMIAPAGDVRISLEKYGLSFARLPDWHFIQTSPRGKKLFDLVRLYESSGSAESNRQALYDALASRAYMIAHPRSETGASVVQFTRQIVHDIRLQGYELVGSQSRQDHDIPLLVYVMRYRPPRDSRERDIWLSLRFFLTPKYVFAFYGSARSQQELEGINTLFSTIRFITNRDGSIRQD